MGKVPDQFNPESTIHPGLLRFFSSPCEAWKLDGGDDATAQHSKLGFRKGGFHFLAAYLLPEQSRPGFGPLRVVRNGVIG